eukprot:gene60012-82091_t
MLTLPKPADDRKTDAIVVMTGGPGRIDRGLALLERHAAQRLLVSGVAPEVRAHELAVKYHRPASLFACCVDLGEAMDRLARYMPVISDATAFSVQPEARGRWMVMQHTGGSLPIPRQRVEYALLTMLMQCRWLIRREMEPLAIEF